MKAIKFPGLTVITQLSQYFLKYFPLISQRDLVQTGTASQKAEKPMLLIQTIVEANLMLKVVPTL